MPIPDAPAFVIATRYNHAADTLEREIVALGTTAGNPRAAAAIALRLAMLEIVRQERLAAALDLADQENH